MEHSVEQCKGVNGETCTSHWIQNKRKHLCPDCVYKLKHQGRSKTEVAIEKQQVKQQEQKEAGPQVRKKNRRFAKTWAPIVKENYSNSEKLQEKISQAMKDTLNDLLDVQQVGESEGEPVGELRIESASKIPLATEEELRETFLSKKRTPVKKVSAKQADINKEYAETCKQIDSQRDMICDGCGQHQGGDIVLSHSHIIARSDCKRIGRPELIYDENNIKLHCLDFAGHVGCHTKWANPKKRKQCLDYPNNMKFIKSEVPEMYEKYKAK